MFAVILGGIPFILRHPYIGVLYWTWLSLMNPHRLAYLAVEVPFAQLIVLTTFAGILFTKDERRWKAGPEVYVLIVLLVWMSVTTLFAFAPNDAFDLWKKVMKIQVMTFVALVVLYSRRHIELFVWALALSVGFYGVKGGVYTIATGGSGRVWGPEGSFIEDNNALALATVMTIPLLYHLFTETKQRLIKLGLVAAMVLCAFSVLGSYSRGALLAMGAMGAFLWLHSQSKLLFGAAIAVLVPLLLAFMPESWDARMRTIVEYQGEGSAESRLVIWGMLFRIANDRFFGAGFALYSRKLFDIYMPEWPTLHSAHSIYFQLLGEHGWIGLALFLLMWFLAWRCSRWIIKNARDRTDLKWARSLSSMIQVSLVGFFVGGAFLNLAYWDLPYYELVALVLVRDLVRRQLAAESVGLHAEPRESPGRAATRSAMAGTADGGQASKVEQGERDGERARASRST